MIPRALLLLLALAGCAANSHAVRSPPPGPPPSATLAASLPASVARSAEVASPDTPHRIGLRFDLNGRAFPLPLVHGSVAGIPVWMLVDTGANSHVIASWVAHQAGLSMHALGAIGSDHTGRTVKAYTVEHAAFAIDDWGTVGDGPILVTDVAEPFARIGIGAFVSPQWLASAGQAVVLDFPNREMRTAPWADAVAMLDARPGHELVREGGLRLCEDNATAIHGLLYVLSASIDGRHADLWLDTGAHRTDLLTASRAGRLLAGRAKPSREQMYGVSGLVSTSLVRAAAIKIGDWSLTADIDLVPGAADPVCPRDGVVSMDALSTCTLLLGRKELRGRCGP